MPIPSGVETVGAQLDGVTMGGLLVSEFQIVAAARLRSAEQRGSASALQAQLNSYLTNPETGMPVFPDPTDIPEALKERIGILTPEAEQATIAAGEAMVNYRDASGELTDKFLHEWNRRKVKVEALVPGSKPITALGYSRTHDALVQRGHQDIVRGGIMPGIDDEHELSLRPSGLIDWRNLSHYAARIVDDDGEPLVRVTFL